MNSAALTSLVSLLLFLVIYLFFFRKYALDRYREELFKVRAGLFDLAMSGEPLSFRSELYRNFELLINNTIRFAHKVSFPSAILFTAMNRIRYPGASIQSKLASDLNHQINSMKASAASSRIKELKAAFDTQTIFYLLRTSPLFILFVSVVVFWFMLKKIVQPARARSLVKKFLVGRVNREIELQAENYGLAPA